MSTATGHTGHQHRFGLAFARHLGEMSLAMYIGMFTFGGLSRCKAR